ncbi:glycoside hydrolase family 32 protein [Myriangium duriaei CBS 260.36]|uniref:Glycoside hydrolase family 32 protein n=1 Tax=Myriangium duriaei CBS 260.36 TaxID=1168546 RepID=A0A9P4MFA5_9PEZI|nr:glycoside hydrolase family 32 protein [Myriangium duriaei CBS 260.36]
MFSLPAVLLTASLATVSLAQDLTDDIVNNLGNNTLFTRWRPTSHFIAPAGWMNASLLLCMPCDPCGFMYDPTRKEYHLFYQWHPEHVNWGNISWGHAVSNDLISWTDVGGWQGTDALALGPAAGGNTTFDGLGIFSGTGQPVNLQGEQDGTLTVFYTSVQYLPIGWNVPYIPGSESQSLATSTDGGITWKQYEKNPVIQGPPGDWNITGFRDPFFEPWPLLDTLLGQTEPHYYAVFGSGIRGVGPRIPLWTAPANDLTNWTFLGALFEPEKNSSFGNVFSTGSNGFNYEVSGFFSLPDEQGDIHYYVNMGTEGGNVSFHESNHWALVYEGHMSRRANGSAAFNPIAGGPADQGLLYAITSFNDTKNNRRIQIGWAPEDIGGSGNFSILQQGYQGSLSLPRELFVQTTRGVVDNDGVLGELGPCAISQQSNGSFVSRTLGVRPAQDVVSGLRNGTTQRSFCSNTYNETTTLVANATSHFELKATISNITGPAGFKIAASPDGREFTTISFDPANYSVIVNRASSSLLTGFNNASVTAYFRPYHIVPEAGGPASVESLNFDIFLDGSLLEVFINERFALTTRIYPALENSTGLGVWLGDNASAVFENVNHWGDLYNVWPERPLNSSSPLVWDTPEETNDYVWWTGN